LKVIRFLGLEKFGYGDEPYVASEVELQ
jgi:hypothetical protein